VGKHSSELHHYAPWLAHWDKSTDEEDETDVDDWEWIDEDFGGLEGVADNDLLQLEFHIVQTMLAILRSVAESGCQCSTRNPCFMV
jgi:hypothetical protein